MSEWQRIPDAEDDETPEVWAHQDYGNIVKTEGIIGPKYHAMVPAVFALGPFDDLKEAQRQVLLNYDVILKLAQSFDEKMLKHIESLRGEENYKKELK